jgi:hypothetical protein
LANEGEPLPAAFPIEFGDHITRGELLRLLSAFAHLLDACPDKNRTDKLPRIIRQLALQVRANGQK